MHIVRASEDPPVTWEKFKSTLGSRGWTTRLALRRQIYHAEKQNTQSMRAWKNSIRELARKISELGGIVSDDELIVVLTKVGSLSFEFTDAVPPRTHRLCALLLRVV